MNTKLALLVLASALCCGPSNAQMPVAWPGGRMAITSDGNAHDPDDIGGTPMAIAIMYAAGLSDRLVHVDYANHFVHKGHEGGRKQTCDAGRDESECGWRCCEIRETRSEDRV